MLSCRRLVERMDAVAAVERQQPQGVLCCWQPFRVDWTAAFRACPSVMECGPSAIWRGCCLGEGYLSFTETWRSWFVLMQVPRMPGVIVASSSPPEAYSPSYAKLVSVLAEWRGASVRCCREQAALRCHSDVRFVLHKEA